MPKLNDSKLGKESRDVYEELQMNVIVLETEKLCLCYPDIEPGNMRH